MTSGGVRTRGRAPARVNDRNVLLVVVGVALVVAALSGLLWYSTDGGNNVAGTGFTFADLRANADSLDAAAAAAYFDWLAWTLLVVAAFLALLAQVPVPGSDAFRVAGFVAGLSGLVATWYSLTQLFDAQRAAGASGHSVLHNATFGVWSTLLGFLALTVAAASGPRRARGV